MPSQKISGKRFLIFALCALGSLMLAGCGNKATPGSASDDAAPHASGESTPSHVAESRPARPRNRTGTDGRRYVGEIPLDVWFDDPLTIARNDAPLGGAPASGNAPLGPPSPGNTPTLVHTAGANPPVAPPRNDPGTKPASPGSGTAPGGVPVTTKPAGTSAGGWKSLISAEVITDEVKSIRSRFSNSLQTVSKYNGNYKDLQVDGAVLAALAAIAAVHPDAVSWKQDAPLLRDLAADMGKKAKGLAQPSYDNTHVAFDRLDGVLSGNRPPDLPKAEPAVPFSEVAGRGPLMRRMDRSFQFLKSSINSDSSLKSAGDKAIQEATLLATLGQVLLNEGYPGIEEAEYQKFLKDLVQAMLAATTAARDSDFKVFSDQLSLAQKTCNECHSSYRFGE